MEEKRKEKNICAKSFGKLIRKFNISNYIQKFNYSIYKVLLPIANNVFITQALHFRK